MYTTKTAEKLHVVPCRGERRDRVGRARHQTNSLGPTGCSFTRVPHVNFMHMQFPNFHIVHGALKDFAQMLKKVEFQVAREMDIRSRPPQFSESGVCFLNGYLSAYDNVFELKVSSFVSILITVRIGGNNIGLKNNLVLQQLDFSDSSRIRLIERNFSANRYSFWWQKVVNLNIRTGFHCMSLWLLVWCLPESKIFWTDKNAKVK